MRKNKSFSGIVCPVCGGDTAVLRSERIKGSQTRRRKCCDCGHRLTTLECLISDAKPSKILIAACKRNELVKSLKQLTRFVKNIEKKDGIDEIIPISDDSENLHDHREDNPQGRHTTTSEFQLKGFLDRGAISAAIDYLVHAPEPTLRINSEGGEATEALELMSLLLSRHIVKCKIEGKCGGVAFAVASCCAQRLANSGAEFAMNGFVDNLGNGCVKTMMSDDHKVTKLEYDRILAECIFQACANWCVDRPTMRRVFNGGQFYLGTVADLVDMGWLTESHTKFI